MRLSRKRNDDEDAAEKCYQPPQPPLIGQYGRRGKSVHVAPFVSKPGCNTLNTGNLSVKDTFSFEFPAFNRKGGGKKKTKRTGGGTRFYTLVQHVEVTGEAWSVDLAGAVLSGLGGTFRMPL